MFAQYAWSNPLAAKRDSFISGWLMVVACTCTVAGVNWQCTSSFPRYRRLQLVGDGTGSYDFAGDAVLIGTVVVMLTAAKNAVGVNVISVINNIGVAVGLIASVLLMVLLALHIRRSGCHHGYGCGESPFLSPTRFWSRVRLIQIQLSRRPPGCGCTCRPQRTRPAFGSPAMRGSAVVLVFEVAGGPRGPRAGCSSDCG